MGKKHISLTARDRLRQAGEQQKTPFIPTLTVERHVIIDAKAAEDMQDRMNQNLKDRLRKSQRSHYRALDPNTMRLRLVENAPLTSENPLQEANELALKLGTLLLNAPQWLKLPTGKVDVYEEAHPFKRFRTRRVIGFEPKGWDSTKGRYAKYDENGWRLPLALLSDESAVCMAALGHPVKSPYAQIIGCHGDMPYEELRSVKLAAEEALLPETEWQDPVIYVRTGRQFNAIETINVRAPNVYKIAA